MDGATRIDNNIVDIGADEVDCTDVYHVKDLDWDGLVGLGDFGLFSRAWVSWNPYVLDPNCPDHTYYTGDPASPQYVEAADCVHWNARCNWASTGTSQYTIDLADLLMWLEEDWMWAACWRLDISAMQQTASLNVMSVHEITENRLLAVDSIGTTDRKTFSPQKSIRQEALELQDAIQFLEQLWLDDPAVREMNTTESWNSFMQSLQESLVELKTKTNTNNLSEEVQ